MTDKTWTDFAPEPDEVEPGLEWNVFLSYRSVDRRWVLNLYDVLREHGHEVFLDQVVLVGGTPLIGQLKKNLKASRAGVLIWSKAAADSEWVEKEYDTMENMATEGDFHFVPIRLDDTELPGFADLKIFFDFSAYPEGPNGGELLRLMHAITGKPLSEEAAHFAAAQDERSKKATNEVEAAIMLGNADRLIELARAGGLAWDTTSVLGCLVAEGLIGMNRYADALQVLDDVEAKFDVAIRPKQLRALALARTGGSAALEQAQLILATLANEHRDPETMGILGRTWMDRYAESGNQLHLQRSRDLYAEGFAGTPDDYCTGINAASKSVLLGDDKNVVLGQEYAKQVEAIVGTETTPNDYWATATVGEVQLLQGNYEAAGERYLDAAAMSPDALGDHETTWLQACRLMRVLKPTDEQRAHVRCAFNHLPDCDEMRAEK